MNINCDRLFACNNKQNINFKINIHEFARLRKVVQLVILNIIFVVQLEEKKIVEEKIEAKYLCAVSYRSGEIA